MEVSKGKLKDNEKFQHFWWFLIKLSLKGKERVKINFVSAVASLSHRQPCECQVNLTCYLFYDLGSVRDEQNHLFFKDSDFDGGMGGAGYSF